MAASRLPFTVLALGFALAKFTGCTAPQGPIGGMHVGGCLAKCGHYTAPTCEENDPQIVPPHSNFHPLPARPVFSRPPTIENAFSPLPTSEAMENGNAPAAPLEVRNTPNPNWTETGEPSWPEATATRQSSMRR